MRATSQGTQEIQAKMLVDLVEPIELPDHLIRFLPPVLFLVCHHLKSALAWSICVNTHKLCPARIVSEALLCIDILRLLARTIRPEQEVL